MTSKDKNCALEKGHTGNCTALESIDVKLEMVDHPAHYGGIDNPYEAIKVIEAWDLGFLLGNCIKYIARLGKKGDLLEDAHKAQWYLNRFVSNLEKK